MKDLAVMDVTNLPFMGSGIIAKTVLTSIFVRIVIKRIKTISKDINSAK